MGMHSSSVLINKGKFVDINRWELLKTMPVKSWQKFKATKPFGDREGFLCTWKKKKETNKKNIEPYIKHLRTKKKKAKTTITTAEMGCPFSSSDLLILLLNIRQESDGKSRKGNLQKILGLEVRWK